MKLSALIAAIGDDNVRFQNLDNDAINLDWSQKAGGRITFGTPETIGLKGTDRLGLVLWLDRAAVATAIASPTKGGSGCPPKKPSPSRFACLSSFWTVGLMPKRHTAA